MENILKRINYILSKGLDSNCISEINGGLNGNSYQLNIDNQKYFLKIFPLDKLNNHNRIKSELSFINFLRNSNFKNIPEIITYSKKDRWILYKWIVGGKIRNIRKKEVNSLINFLMEIQKLRNKKNLSLLSGASEACFSLIEHQKLIKSKLKITLDKIYNLNDIDEGIKNTIKNDFLKKINSVENIHNRYINYKNFWDYKLKDDELCISPSDIGFHNIIKSDNQLIFFDFEFSGIDDPCKLIVDLIIQPDHPIPKPYIYLIKDFIKLFNKKIPLFNLRLQAIFDLYQIKWYCIIFNPLIKNKIPSTFNNIKKTFIKSKIYFNSIEKIKSEVLIDLN